MLAWDNKIVQTWFKHSFNKNISENERQLYYWLALSRHNILIVINRHGDKVMLFYNMNNE